MKFLDESQEMEIFLHHWGNGGFGFNKLNMVTKTIKAKRNNEIRSNFLDIKYRFLIRKIWAVHRCSRMRFAEWKWRFDWNNDQMTRINVSHLTRNVGIFLLNLCSNTSISGCGIYFKNSTFILICILCAPIFLLNWFLTNNFLCTKVHSPHKFNN